MMKRNHPTDAEIDRLLQHLTLEDLEVLLHGQDCPPCERRLYRRARLETHLEAWLSRKQAEAEKAREEDNILPWQLPEEASQRLGALEGRIGGPLLAQMEARFARAAERLAEFLAQPAERRALLLRNDPGYRTYELASLLLNTSWERRGRSPETAESLAHWALAILDQVDPAEASEGLVADLKARAWGYIANLRRKASDLEGAEEAFQAAEGYLQLGTGDDVEAGLLLWLKGSLLRAQREFVEALDAYYQALAHLRKVEEEELIGRILVNLGHLYWVLGEPLQAVRRLEEALEHVDREAEPRLYLCALHNLLLCYCDLGNPLEAQRLFQQGRGLYERFADEAAVRLRRRWAEGWIALAVGNLAQAEEAFLEVREGFRREKIPYDTALASLDLAAVYLQQERPEEVMSLAVEMAETFQRLEVDREALAAVRLFREAAENREVTPDLLRQTALQLRRVQPSGSSSLD